jgi:hypothetical protein
VQEKSIQVNGTRFRLDNITTHVSKLNNNVTKVKGIMEHYPDRMSLLHPNFWTYWVHTVAQFIACILALKSPKALLVILVVATLCWPISLITGQPIWAMKPLATDWWLMCAKSIIVNICPTVPMLYCLITNAPKEKRQCCGIFVYCILWANVAWTLCFLPMRFNAVSVTNAVCGVSLCISLVIHLVALCRRGVTLFEVKGDIVYGYGTSLSWLVCYTVWNALFVVELAVGVALQDIFFWGMMVAFWYWSDKTSGIENYFAMARPISLSAFIATSDWPGFLSYFRDGIETSMGLSLTKHAFFLFIAMANVLYSLYVLYWAITLFVGLNGADEYFASTFESQKLEALLEDEDDEEEEEDEEALMS